MTEGRDHLHPLGIIQIVSLLGTQVTGKWMIEEARMTGGATKEVHLTEDRLMMTSSETDPPTPRIPICETLLLIHPTLRILAILVSL